MPVGDRHCLVLQTARMDNEQLLSSFAKVLVSDPERSAKFYEALGFKRTQAAPPFIHLQWEKQAEVYLVTLPPVVKLEGQRGLGVLLGFRSGAVEVEEDDEGSSGHLLFPSPTKEDHFHS